jgi:hypothetical protein
MADIKDKLERLKKEREARSRSKSQLVKDTWKEIQKADLSALPAKKNLQNPKPHPSNLLKGNPFSFSKTRILWTLDTEK